MKNIRKTVSVFVKKIKKKKIRSIAQIIAKLYSIEIQDVLRLMS